MNSSQFLGTIQQARAESAAETRKGVITKPQINA
jgi:hypothetical protein